MLKIAFMCQLVLFVSSYPNNRIELTKSLKFVFLFTIYDLKKKKIIISKNILCSTTIIFFVVLFHFEITL
jgi:hypothetical protein